MGIAIYISVKSKSTTDRNPREAKPVMPAIERLRAEGGQVLLLSTERKNVMTNRIEALETEIGRILQIAPKMRKEMGFDAHLEILVQELNALEN